MSSSQLRKLLIGDFTWQRLIRSLIFIYLFFAGYVFWRADSMIFHPPPVSYSEGGGILGEEILKLTTPDEEKIAAVHLPNPDAHYTLLYVHGNAEDLGQIQPVLNLLYDAGFSVFAYDYRGYGLSEGQPSEANAYEDINTAYGYLTETLEIPPDQIIVFGRSVGGGSAIDLASRETVGGVIVESAFTSAFRVVVPFPILPFDKFPNRAKLPEIQVPVLFIHGKADQTVPFHHSQTLYTVANDPKLALWVEGAQHNDLVWVAGKQYTEILKTFERWVKMR
ncbi:alpha/beta hydrolase [Spirulina sp. CS-785/01]|uniref:alpha/beta hydrolase n=1 Tax=Spirulina sp. CS-785/01 TaxID=3021716 RepID=UPI003FA7424C